MGQFLQRLPDVYKVGENRRLLEAIEPHLESTIARIRGMSSYWDPDTAPVERLDVMLRLLGWKAKLELTERQKRKLVKAVNAIHHQAGTSRGIINSLRYILGYEVQIREYLRIRWESEREAFTDGDEKNYTFDVVFPLELRPEDIALAKVLVVYMMDPTTIYRPTQLIQISNAHTISHDVTMTVSVEYGRNVYDPQGLEYQGDLTLDGSWRWDGSYYLHGRRELPPERKSEAQIGGIRIKKNNSTGSQVDSVEL